MNIASSTPFLPLLSVRTMTLPLALKGFCFCAEMKSWLEFSASQWVGVPAIFPLVVLGAPM